VRFLRPSIANGERFLRRGRVPGRLHDGAAVAGCLRQRRLPAAAPIPGSLPPGSRPLHHPALHTCRRPKIHTAYIPSRMFALLAATYIAHVPSRQQKPGGNRIEKHQTTREAEQFVHIVEIKNSCYRSDGLLTRSWRAVIFDFGQVSEINLGTFRQILLVNR
jgi:hypothetical protein